jgi:hypothetical protein
MGLGKRLNRYERDGAFLRFPTGNIDTDIV